MINYLDLSFKFLTLFFLAGASQMAFKNRQWGAMIITFGLWFTVFRTALLKSASLYVGVFNYMSPEIIDRAMKSLMTGNIVVFTDFIALVASFLGFVFFSGSDSDRKKARIEKKRKLKVN